MSDSNSPGSIYRRGRDFFDAKQYARAFEAFNEAAAADYPAALTWLGYMYLHGIVVEKNIPLATESLERAITQGDVHAKGLLGQLWIHGSSGYFLGGISHPMQVMRGIGLIVSGIRDALLSRRQDIQ